MLLLLLADVAGKAKVLYVDEKLKQLFKMSFILVLFLL
jgi:hypothetical protein